MLGPGLALRGPDGSMHTAVDGMMVEYRVCFLFFVIGTALSRAGLLSNAMLRRDLHARPMRMVCHKMVNSHLRTPFRVPLRVPFLTGAQEWCSSTSRHCSLRGWNLPGQLHCR